MPSPMVFEPLGLLSLGAEHLSPGTRLGVDPSTSSEKILLPEGNSVTSRLRADNAREGSNREMSESFISRQVVRRAQEGLRQEKTSTRPLAAEHLHKMRQVQDDDSGPRPKPSSQRGLDIFYRSVRRVLACPDQYKVSPFPWLCGRSQEISFQSNAFRPKYSPLVIHETGQSGPGPAQTNEYSDSRLPRRLANLGTFESGMRSCNRESSAIPEVSRFSDQRKEIQDDTCSQVSMARAGMGSDGSHLSNTEGQEGFSSLTIEKLSSLETDHEEETGSDSWLSSVSFDSGSEIESETQGFSPNLEEVCKTETEGRLSTLSPKFPIVAPLDQARTVQQERASGSSSCVFVDSYGCFKRGLGGSHQPANSRGPLVSDVQEI